MGGTLTTVSAADSIKSTFAADKMDSFAITGSNTLDVPNQSGQQWTFSSETKTKYQLLTTKNKNSARFTTFMAKAK